MDIRQSGPEIDANFEAVAKQLLPAKMKVSNANVVMIYNYVAHRYRGTDGLVDMSAVNIGRAVPALVNAIEWDVPPVKKPVKKPVEVQGLTRIKYTGERLREQEAERAKLQAARAHSEAQQAEHNQINDVLTRIQEYIDNQVRFPHSAQAKLKEKLQLVFNQRGLKLTREQAEELFRRIQRISDETPDGPRPPRR